MKKLTLLLTIIGLPALLLGQDVEGKLSEAQSNYQGKDLEGTRFALQQSLTELDILVGQEILKLLPESLAGNIYNAEEDAMVGGALGFSGVFVSRNYPGETKSVEIELVTDSPYLSVLSTFLTNPLLARAGGANQKVIKVDNYKGKLTKDENEPNKYELQIPIDQSLFSIRYEGFESESEVTAIAGQIGLGAVANLLR